MLREQEPSDDENDMLDLAFGLTRTSRLGCQVLASKELDGMTVRLPAATRNFSVDGFVPKPVRAACARLALERAWLMRVSDSTEERGSLPS